MVQLAPRENPYLATLEEFPAARTFSETTATAVDAEVHRIISESHEEALRLLRQHRHELDSLAAALLDRETVDEQEILKVTGLSAAPALNAEKLSTNEPG
jgi:cell division protease FtsH